MGADSRQNALIAATDFLDQEFQDNTRAAIFRVNLRLNAIHGFTNNRAALAAAVRAALTGNGTINKAVSLGGTLSGGLTIGVSPAMSASAC